MADAPKRIVIRGSIEQIATLTAAFVADKTSSADADRLAKETGLPSQWIKSWFVRFRKKESKKREATPDEDEAPPKKRGRPRNSPPPSARGQLLSVKAEPARNFDLPPPDDSYMRAPSPIADYASTSNTARRPLLSYTPLPSSHGHAFYLNHPHLAPVSEQQKPSSSRQLPLYYLNAPPSGPMLLPPRPLQLPENINPAPQHVYERTKAWGTTPASTVIIDPLAYSSTVTPAALLAVADRNASSHNSTLASSKSTSHSTLLRRTPFPTNQQSVPGEPSPFHAPHKNTPAHILQSPISSPFSQEPSNHTQSLISPSHLQSYMPEHDIKQEDSKSTTSFSTPIDDKFLFSSVMILWRQALSLIDAGF
ncbi:hypothetical protein C8R44DRAFT_771737 [Mycena epipterygia]|nr:hypothetical protein C8R44DRAFT_771737 [Mycena epipterygia]